MLVYESADSERRLLDSALEELRRVVGRGERLRTRGYSMVLLLLCDRGY